MLRPYPFSYSPNLPQLNNIHTTSPVASGITSAIIDDVFSCVNYIGLDAVYGLCQQQLQGQLDNLSIQQLDFGDAATLHWLTQLSQQGLVEVQNSLAALRTSILSILGPLQQFSTRDVTVLIWLPSHSRQTPDCKILARAGSIYRQDAQGNEVMLMTFVQFLNKAKPSWQLSWNLAGLDLTNLNLSGAHLDFANLAGTSLHRTNLSGASLVGANVKNTGLDKANVSGTNFSRANLNEAFSLRINFSAIKLDTDFLLKPKLTCIATRPTILNALFRTFKNIGLEEVMRLCQNNFDTTGLEPYARYQDIYLLVTLSRDERQLVVLIAQELQKKIPEIVAVFHPNANRGKEIVVYPASPSATDGVQIVAKAGCVYWRNQNDSELHLVMSVGQFFNWHFAPGEEKTWNLAGMDFSHMDLTGAKFRNANLSGANLCRTTLKDVDFEKANLSLAILREASLIDTNIHKANLNKADLRWCEMNEVYFHSADLIWANLSGATMIHVDFDVANLCGTNFTDVKGEQIDFFRAQFDQMTNLQGASIRLEIDIHGNYDNDQLFAHLNNPENGSLLTSINALDERYLNQAGKIVKLDLMHQAIEYMKKEVDDDEWANLVESVLDMFTNNPLYLNDPLICSFINDTILPVRITQANSAELKVYGAPELRLLLQRVQLDAQQAQFMLDNNGFFIQLMLLCAEQDVDPTIQQQAQQLYAHYLRLDELSGVRELIEDVAGGDIRLLDGLEKHITTKAALPAGACFAFIQRGEDRTHILILDRAQLRAMQRANSSDTECKWDALCYATRQPQQALTLVPPSAQSLPEIVEVFSLFNNAYQFKLNNATFIRLLQTIHLKYDNLNNEANYVARDYTALFLEALNSPHSATKLCDEQNQLTLTAIFSPLLVERPLGVDTYLTSVNIAEPHYADLLNVYDLSGASPLIKAQTMFCLAAVFAKYSSTHLFGRETDSPQALRAYAAALMVKAYELEPSLFANATNTAEENFLGWTQAMLGGKDNSGRAIFTCSAVISREMLAHTRQTYGFNAIAITIKPPAWN